jgi:predicted XRE-type DNA-binding protein
MQGYTLMAATQTLFGQEYDGRPVESDLMNEIDRLVQENRLLQEDNKQLRAAAHIYRSTVSQLMKRRGVPFPQDNTARLT